MSSTTLRRGIWLSLWLLILGGCYFYFQKADRSFTDYISKFDASKQNVGELFPSNITLFFYDQNFQQNWEQFRASDFFSSIRNVALLHDVISNLSLDEKEPDVSEKWVFNLWRSNVAVGYSEEDDALYLMTPLGNREQCFDWLRVAVSTAKAQNFTWKPRQIGGNWCIDLEDLKVWPGHGHAQFYPIQGMAVLAVGSKPDPLKRIFEIMDSPQKCLFHHPDFPRFFEEGFQKGNKENQKHFFGFVRKPSEMDSPYLGKTWGLTLNERGGIEAEFNVPEKEPSIPSVHSTLFSVLVRFQQQEDLISLLTSWSELKGLFEKSGSYLSKSIQDTVSAVQADSLLGAYTEFWKPLLKETGDEFFISFGEPGYPSSKFHIPFPRTVLAVPFQDRKNLFHALEQSVAKSNEELQSNLLVRKVVRDCGEYYEVKMKESAWKDFHGLKELPVFSLKEDLLILASSADAMEGALQSFQNTTPSSDESNGSEELVLKMDMKKAPGLLQILFPVFGLLHPQDENVFLSPKVTAFFNDLFSVTKNFEKGKMEILNKSNQTQIRIKLD